MGAIAILCALISTSLAADLTEIKIGYLGHAGIKPSLSLAGTACPSGAKSTNLHGSELSDVQPSSS